MSRLLKSTRADQFNAKVHGLKEIFNRLDRRTYPLPTGNDVANYLKWFQLTLQSLVKETHPVLSESKQSFDRQQYPSMDYTGLYKALGKIVNVVPVVELGVEAFADSVLSILASLVPFLKMEDLNAMPVSLAMMLSIWPSQTHNHIIKLLAGYVLPVLLGVLQPEDGGLSYASLSCPALIMTILQYCPDCKQHAQFVETLMRFKSDVCLDILAVLAYGPQPVINSAGQILLHYYPLKDVGGADDWQFVYEPWHPPNCQNLECAVPRNNTPTKMCLDASYASAQCGSSPPVFICKKCAELAQRSITEKNLMVEIIQPMGKMRTTCETKECKGQGKPCSVMCFSYECVKDNRFRALTMCQDCHFRYHGAPPGKDHVTQNLFPDPWTLHGPDQAYPTEAVIRLLGEAQPCQKTRNEAMGLDQNKLEEEFVDDVDNDINNRRMLSRLGVRLLVGVCSEPARCESAERLGRLVSMVLSWIETTSTLRRDRVGELLKGLTSQDVCRWLTQVRENKLDLFCACLCPNPPEYIRVGGCWDAMSSKVRQHMEGLHRLCCLIPHNLITPEVWEVIMPQWMEAIKADVPPYDLGRFKVLLTKIFDPLLSPLKLPPDITLGFIKKALESAVPRQQVEALTWLQILSQLNIIIRLDSLLSMFIKAVLNSSEFAEGVSTMFPFPMSTAQSQMSTGMDGNLPVLATPVSGVSSDLGELSSNLSCFIMKLDLLVKQVNIQFTRERHVVNSAEREDIKKLLKCMLDISWAGNHGDHLTLCDMCNMADIWFKLAYMLLESVFPEGGSFVEDEVLSSVAYGSLFRSFSSNKTISVRSLGSSKNQVETIDEVFKESQQDFPRSDSAPNMASSYHGDNDPEPESVISEGDTPSEPGDSVISFAGLGSMSASIGSWRSGTSSSSWGAICDNYPQLNLLLGFLKELPRQEDHNVQLSILKCLKVLILRGDYMRFAMDADTDFLAYLQEIFLIPNLWGLLQAEHSEMSQLCVGLLLHCICLPYGAEKLCDEVESAFADDDWRERFSAVEKVTMIARFLEKENVKSNNIAMSALAHCLTYLVGAVEDVCTPVHLRAITMLGTIRASSLKVLYTCIEHQYDAVPRDRLLLIHTCRILHRTLPHHTPLCGRFFISRFKHLLIENADFVSYGSPKGRSASSTAASTSAPTSDTSVDGGSEIIKKIALVLRPQMSTRSLMAGNGRLTGNLGQARRSTSSFRCSYTFRFPGEKVTYNRQVSASSEGKRSSSGSRQRRTGGFVNQAGSIDISDRMFLGGRIQTNLPTVQEEEHEGSRQSLDSVDSSLGQLMTSGGEGGSLEAEATHQMVTLVMDFLSYPGGSKDAEEARFQKTESYEVIQMSHYLGVLMGYDIKVGEFTGNPRRLRQFPVFHAYIAGIAQVLDQNQQWGSELLNLTLQLLLFCAAPRPQKRTQVPEFSLVRLPQYMRHAWLMACLIILYKYPFHADAHKRDTKNLIHLAINTLEAQNHVCKGTKDGLTKRPSMASLLGDSFTVGTGEGHSRSETPGGPRSVRYGTDRQLSSPATFTGNSKPFEEDYKPKPERQISSPSKLGYSKVQVADEDERDKDEKALEGANHASQLPEVSEAGGVNSSELLLPSSPPVQDLSPSPGGALQLVANREDVKGLVSKVYGVNEEETEAEKKTRKVSIDSSSSRDTREVDISRPASVEGSLAVAGNELRRGSKPKLYHGLSTRSFDKVLDSTVDKEPFEDDLDLDSCPDCGCSLEEFDEETLNLCIVVLSTFVHQSPSMAMPFLLRMLECVARKCVYPLFPWQEKSNVLMPGSTREVSKQFLRCVLIKLAPNGVFSELFRCSLKDDTLLKAVAIALNDFSSFDQMSPIAYLLEDILGSRTLGDRVLVLLSNLDSYFKFASREPASAWESQLSHFETFFRKLPSVLPENCDLTPTFRIMSTILNAASPSFKMLLAPFAQVISYAVNKGSFQLQCLIDLCIKCTDTFPKERNKLFLTRAVVLELVHAVKFRSSIPDANLQSVLQERSYVLGGVPSTVADVFVAVDAGSRISFGSESDNAPYDLPFGSRTRALDCIRQYMGEAVEFIKDWNFTARSSKENRTLSEPNLNTNTLPIDLKASVSQLVALELTKHSKDSKIYNKALAWLKSPPTASQLGRQEVLDCVTHIRLLAWLLHGSLSHFVHRRNPHVNCHPITFEENTHIADYVLIILFSFAEPLREPPNKSALYHAFNVCELWTLYCDQTSSTGDSSLEATSIIMEFWGRVTPGILHLLTQAKEVTQNVSHHFLNLLEALQECNSTPFPKLYPMWYPILTYCFSQGLSDAAQARLRKAQSRRRINKDTKSALAKWLKQLQFKMALTEQSPTNELIHYI